MICQERTGILQKGSLLTENKNWGAQSKPNGIGALRSSTLGAIRLLMGSVKVLTCWVKEMVLTTPPENRGSVMDKDAFHKKKAMQKMIKNSGHTLLYLPLYFPHRNPI
ncbi:hypothetical protein HCUR_00955 [Holospora curviuscula]|uniref:Tc1-like transposase DDE domain-containing protein n=2 Tax=Holospora curviuscula TaxID=1082868 RepID=A0A2S5R8G5_9PROT|nr:hypothetical protein HCUR_00955 [Holospora curviuscula]